MLPTGIKPYIINVQNLSSTTAYPVTILDAYNTLAYTNSNLLVWSLTIVSATLPNNTFYFQYINANGVLSFSGALVVGDVFSCIAVNNPTLIAPLPTIPYSYTVGGNPISTANFYQNNQNIKITMNPNMNCTYQQFLEATMTNPFSIDTIYFSSNNASQIAQVDAISMFFKDINGDEAQKELPIFIDPYQSSSEGVIIQNKNDIDGFTGIEIQSLLPATSFELYLYPRKRAELKLSKNKQFIENNNVIGFKQNSLNEFNNFIQNRKKQLGLD